MEFSERLQNVSVIGAAGKMGSGIAVLLAQEIAKEKLKPENKNKLYRLNCIDVAEAGLDGLQSFIKTQATKIAEKSTVMLRDLYADRMDLVENYDIITQFTEDMLANVRLGTELSMAKNSHLVFEAIIEDKDIKVPVLEQLNELCPKDAYFFTNTSSIPIGILNKEVDLGGRIIGYHFYNPPIVQKLAELIPAEDTLPELREASYELGKRLRKTIVLSNDKAGFIGNGHFSRDGLYAVGEVERLSKDFSKVEAIYMVNKISQDLLVRPMGIFQLIDYVGTDVFHSILNIINQYTEDEELHSDLVDLMVERKVIGGQRADGSQKDGFLKYEGARPMGVYDPESGEYKMLDPNGWSGSLDKKLGSYPDGFKPWKSLLVDPAKDDKLRAYFKNLLASATLDPNLLKPT